VILVALATWSAETPSFLRALAFRAALVKRFLAKHDSLGVWARANTPWEAIAIGAGIDLPHLLGAALLARRDDATTRANLIAIRRAPELMKKRIEYAKLPGGWRDRDALEKLVLGLP
jgi:hypothetical protein